MTAQRNSVRPTWDEYFLAVARVAASRATCDRASVGAVIVSRDNRILSTGYNGSPPGEPHCDDAGHLMEDGHCQRTIHAETNAIAWAARVGVSLMGARLYIWSSSHHTTPCRECMKVVKAAGILFVPGGPP